MESKQNYSSKNLGGIFNECNHTSSHYENKFVIRATEKDYHKLGIL